MSQQPTVLITGAAGFIGSHAAQAFLARGWKVVGLDNFNDFYDRRWKERNVKAIESGEDASVAGSAPASNGGKLFSLIEADITDAKAVESAFATHQPTAVLHLAAMAGVRPSIERPAHYAHINVQGTTHLLESARKHGTQKFLFASSSSVYGNNPKVPFSEADNVDEPISPYAATKKAGELLCHTYWNLYKLPIFCLRFFTVYGPRQRPDLAIHKFARLIDAGKSLPVFGDGSTSRDYTYVSDTVAGIVAAMDKCDRYRIYNLGGSSPVSLAQLLKALENAMGKQAIIDRKPSQPGDVERTYADLSRSTPELGYAPKVSIEEGLKRFVAWFARYKNDYPFPL